MQRTVLTVTEDDSLPDVVDMFVSRRYRRIPVVRDGKLVGIISRRDLIRFTRELRQIIQGARNEEKLLFRTKQEIADHCGIDRSVVIRGLQSGDAFVVKDGDFYRCRKTT